MSAMDPRNADVGKLATLVAGVAVLALLLGTGLPNGASVETATAAPPAAAAASAEAAAGPAVAATDGSRQQDASDSATAGQQEAGGHGGASQEAGDGSSAQGEEGGGGHGGGPDIPRIFLVLISALLLAKFLGEGFERVGQPAVLGELLAGVILGGSVLGVIPGPEAGTTLVHVLEVMAEIGVAILLFEIGLETDLKEMFRVGGSATAVALVGVLLPAGLGFAYWYYFDPQIGAHPAGVEFWMVAIFVGATLTATSVGITARVLTDLDQLHTPEARVIIGAAVIDDVLGIVLLSVVAGLVTGAAVTAMTVVESIVVAFGFLVAAVVIGNWAAPYLFDLVDKMRVRGVLLVTALSFALLVGALADMVGSAMIIGAFAAGIVLSSTNQFDTVVERVEPVADIFTPIFFVWVGVPVNVALFIPGTEDFSTGVLAVGGILTLIAIVSKVIAGYSVRDPEVSSSAIGMGMVPRGEVGLIFASIGLSTGVLSSAVYSAILIMVIVTTFMAPPFLKVIFENKAEAEAAAAEASAGEEMPEV